MFKVGLCQVVRRVVFPATFMFVYSSGWAWGDADVRASVEPDKREGSSREETHPKTAHEFSVTNATVSVTVETLDSFQAEQARLKALIAEKPKAYVDKVMDSDDVSKLESLEALDQPEKEQPEGFRSYFLEGRFNQQATDIDLGKETNRSFLLRGGYQQETLNYGAFDLQFTARDGHDDIRGAQDHSSLQSARYRLRNVGFPVTTNISSDTSVGDISSELTDAFERTGRLALGSSAIRGAATRIYRRDQSSGFDLRLGHGQRQTLSDERYRELEGALTWLGYSRRITDKTFIGFQFNQLQDASGQSVASVSTGADEVDVDSFAVSLGYGQRLSEHGDNKARVVGVYSRVSEGEKGHEAQGWFIEAGFLRGRYQHEFGLYHSSKPLNFADFLLADKGYGGHWRTDYRGLRLNLGGGFEFRRRDAVQSDEITELVSIHTNARYRINRQRAIGGSMRLSDSRTEAGHTKDRQEQSLYVTTYYQVDFDAWGKSRMIATIRRNQNLVDNSPAASGEELQWEHDWVTGKYSTMRPEFKTSLGWAHDRSENERTTYPTAGLNMRYWMNADWNIGANLRLTARDSNLSTSRGVSGSLNSEYSFGKGWQLGGAVHLNQARVTVEGSDFAEAQISRSRDKSAYLYARWDGNKGKPFSLLGQSGVSAQGSGNIEGVVYFDLNRDGQQQLDEKGVPGVEVLLDDTYLARTDRDGKFEFLRVTTGQHQLSLNMNTVPLPWGEGEEGNRFDIKIPLRGRANKRIPVVRLGG